MRGGEGKMADQFEAGMRPLPDRSAWSYNSLDAQRSGPDQPPVQPALPVLHVEAPPGRPCVRAPKGRGAKDRARRRARRDGALAPAPGPVRGTCEEAGSAARGVGDERHANRTRSGRGALSSRPEPGAGAPVVGRRIVGPGDARPGGNGSCVARRPVLAGGRGGRRDRSPRDQEHIIHAAGATEGDHLGVCGSACAPGDPCCGPGPIPDARRGVVPRRGGERRHEARTRMSTGRNPLQARPTSSSSAMRVRGRSCRGAPFFARAFAKRCVPPRENSGVRALPRARQVPRVREGDDRAVRSARRPTDLARRCPASSHHGRVGERAGRA
jgi:hypothetical protein